MRAAALGAVLAILPAPPAPAREGGLEASLVWSERLVAGRSGNGGTEDGAYLRTDLDLGVRSATRSRRFRLDLRGGIDKRPGGGGLDIDVADRLGAVFHEAESRNARFTAGLRMERRDVGAFLAPAVPDGGGHPASGGEALVVADAERDREDARIGLEFGRAGPFGGTVFAARGRVRYGGDGGDAAAAGLVGSDRADAGLRLRLEVHPRATARAVVEASDLDRAGGADARTRRAGMGATVALGRTLGVVEFDLGVVRVERGGAVPAGAEEDPWYSLGVWRQLPGGTLGGSVAADTGEHGRRTALRLDRWVETPGGSLNLGLGLSRDGESGGADPLLGLSWVRELPRGRLSLDADRSLRTTSAGGETAETGLVLSFERRLGAGSALRARADFRESRESRAGGGGGKTSRTGFGVDWSHALARGVEWVAGYERVRREGPGVAGDEDRVHFGIRMSRTWRR